VTQGQSPEANPTASRWELGGRLRRLRLDAGLTIEEVAQELEVSITKISRLESGQRPATARDVKDLGKFYNLAAAEVGDLRRLAVQARATPWYAEFPGLTAPTMALFDLELVASHYQVYNPTIVPGLLQTPDYTKHLLKAVFPDADDEPKRTEIAKARIRRQEAVLAEAPALRAHLVIDEAVLVRPVGGSKVMREQVHHLLETSHRPNVTFQVFPFDRGAHAGLLGPFMLLHFDGPAIRDAVYLEALHADWFLDRPSEVAPYQEAFQRLERDALDPDASRQALSRIASRFG
jgi:transcriptional regulator with XRE-family HTH domain